MIFCIISYINNKICGIFLLVSKDFFEVQYFFRGNLGACHVRLENTAHPVKYQGVVCSMKESFGFIERADIVKEIFFHFSEAKTKEELRLGDDVEFIIQTRNVSVILNNSLSTSEIFFLCEILRY